MADLEQQLREDRAMRNAAKSLVMSSFGNVKGDMSQRGLGARVAGRAKDGAAQIADDSADFVRSHGGQLGTGLLIGAFALVGWAFREQIADAIYDLIHRGEMTTAPEKKRRRPKTKKTKQPTDIKTGDTS